MKIFLITLSLSIFYSTGVNAEEKGKENFDVITSLSLFPVMSKENIVSRGDPIRIRLYLNADNPTEIVKATSNDIKFSVHDELGNEIESKAVCILQEGTDRGGMIIFDMTIPSEPLTKTAMATVKDKVIDLLKESIFPKEKLDIIEQFTAEDFFLVFPINISRIGNFEIKAKIVNGKEFNMPLKVKIEEREDVATIMAKKFIENVKKSTSEPSK